MRFKANSASSCILVKTAMLVVRLISLIKAGQMPRRLSVKCLLVNINII